MPAGRIKTAEDYFKKACVVDLVTVIEGDAHETVKPHNEPIDILTLSFTLSYAHALLRSPSNRGISRSGGERVAIMDY